MIKYVVAALYVATIPLANWLIGHVGTVCADHVCLLPVGFGLMAPSGVLMIGVAFVLRDVLQRIAGVAWGIGCIVLGTAVSAFLAPAALVLASATAFALGEFLDFAVYTPLQKRGLIRAVFASSCLASVVDSALFLLLAFGSTQLIAGQIIGKWIAVLLAMPLVIWARTKTGLANEASHDGV